MIKDFFALIYPEVCPCCENVLLESEKFVCSSCFHTLPIFEDNLHPALQKLAGRVHIPLAYSFLKFNKLGLAQRLLHELKYKGNKEIGVYLGHLLAQDMISKKIELNAEYLVPVPLHSSRLKERGYNQSEMLAIGISEVFNIPVNTNILFKIKESDSQTKKGRMARLANIFECYEAKNPFENRDAGIALIDDVITTGATLEACCKSLENAGFSNLSILSLAVA